MSQRTEAPHRRFDAQLPGWVLNRLHARRFRPPLVTNDSPAVRVVTNASVTFVGVTVPDARSMDGDALQAAAQHAYRLIREHLSVTGKQPVRFWNYIPDLLAPAGDGRDRYMAFNAGRYAALREWLGPENLDSVATASGVGNPGPNLVVHCLATNLTGVAVGNPRQIAPARYSARYGSVPPCFSRATRVQLSASGAPTLLVGGTAAVRGEDSVYGGDLVAQLDETFINLAAVVAENDRLGSAATDTSDRPQSDWLARYREVRVYHPIAGNRRQIVNAIRRRLPRVRRIEVVNVDLCRSDLLVEIEGIADGSAGRPK